MGIGKFLGGLNQGLQQLTPQQRSMLLRTAASTSRSPQGAEMFAQQAQQMDRYEMQRRENAVDDERLRKRMAFEREKFDESIRQYQEAKQADRDALLAQQKEQEQFRTGMGLALPIITGPGSLEEKSAKLAEISNSIESEEFQKWLGRYGLDVVKPPESVVNVNLPGENQPLTKPSMNDVQTNIMAANKQISRLESVADKFKSEYLTLQGKGKAALGSALDKFGMEAGGLAQFNADKGEFKSEVDQFFNEYRKYITGAAASVKELELLKEALFTDEMGPKEFAERFNSFINRANEILEEEKVWAREGLDVSPSNTPPKNISLDDDIIDFGDL